MRTVGLGVRVHIVWPAALPDPLCYTYILASPQPNPHTRVATTPAAKRVANRGDGWKNERTSEVQEKMEEALAVMIS